ncbi:MAG: NUDIX hydrolase [Bacteroides sp.]|nr:NUDIX hydrolase [Bacteroides sp.]MCM1550303.1 NUDIX hydrolase [Clostridium sp.]
MRNADGLTEQEFLRQYRPGEYERPSVTVDMLVFAVNEAFDALRLLLIRRKNHPFLHCWALPGGFVEMDESLDEAARRELKEETGVQDIYMEQLYTFGEPDRDPRTRIISTAYLALIKEEAVEIQAGDDAAEVCWFTVQEQDGRVELHGDNGEVLYFYVTRVPFFIGGVASVEETAYKKEDSGIAFDHEKIIQMGISRLRNKAEYTNVLFGLMPEVFTLPELQRLYEAVLGKSLYKSNFRKKISGYVEATGAKKSQEGTKRSPELYRFRKELLQDKIQ